MPPPAFLKDRRMSQSKTRRPLTSLVIAACVAALPTFALAATTVTLSSTAAGVTPLYVGYNSGHFFPGSNTNAWIDYSGVNAYRIFASAANYEDTAATGLRSGDGITNLAQFDARKAALRADLSANPDSTTYVNWTTYRNRFENSTISGTNKIKLNDALSRLRALDVSPILQITRTRGNPTGSGTPAGSAQWGENYEQWHLYYTMAYHTARNYDVSRFQMFNEPDLPDASGDPANPLINGPEWVARMKLASDAIRSAVTDVNAGFGKSLTPELSAPVSANVTRGYENYGSEAIKTNRIDYAGRAVSYDVVDVYDMHRYGTDASRYTDDIDYVRGQMRADSPTGQVLPVSYTEFNARNTASFATSADDGNTPNLFTAVANNAIGMMTRDTKAFYAFKFNQTEAETEPGVTAPQKTGMHYVNNAASPFDTTGATLSAEVMRLLARGFKGERPRLTQTASGDALTDYTLASSHDTAAGNRYLMGVNRNAAAATYTLDMTGWNVAVGSVVSVEEVSTRRHGEVVRMFTVPANRRLTIAQPSDSVWLLTAPTGPAAAMRTLTPVADAQVRNDDSAAGGDNRTRNYGNEAFARVGRTADGVVNDYVSYFKFDLGNTDAATVDRAILQLSGLTLEGGEVSFHVYALTNDNWTESGINWNNAPNLAGALDPKLLGVGTTAFPVGSLTFTATLGTTGIDLTDFLHDHPDQLLTFALIREEKFTGDAETSYARLASRESATPPTLLLFGGTSVPEPAAVLLIGLPLMMLRRHRVV